MEENLTSEAVEEAAVIDTEVEKAEDASAPLPEPESAAEGSENLQEADTEEREAPEAAEENPLNALVSAGLSEREAMLVLRDREERRTGSVPDALPRAAHSPRLNISYGELAQMREIFDGLSDTEINRLYNKVTNKERI